MKKSVLGLAIKCNMKNIFKSGLMVIMLTIAFSCSKGDEDTNSQTPDNLYETEWTCTEIENFDFYFSNPNTQVSMWYPQQSLILGTYKYNKPNFTLSFAGQCDKIENMFNCEITGKVEGNTLKVRDKNGKDWNFTRRLD
jgi:hypothetical protein